MQPSILIVDDEVEVLKALERVLQSEYQVKTFDNPQTAIDFFRESPTHIVISDLMMPQINGAEFLTEIAKINAKAKRVALTGFASAELAEQAVNQGQISLYLTKPWDNKDLKQKLAQLISKIKTENKKQSFINQLNLDNQQLQLEQQSSLVTLNMMLDEKISQDKVNSRLKSTTNELLLFSANLVAMNSHEPIGHSLRVAQQAKALALRLGIDSQMASQLYFAALFYRIGITSLPRELTKPHWQKLSIQQQYEFQSFVQTSAEVMNSTAAITASANIVKHIYERFDGKGIPSQLAEGDIPIAARILRLVIDFDLLINGVLTESRQLPEQALVTIKKGVNSIYDETVFKAFNSLLNSPKETEQIQLPVNINWLCPEMVLSQDLYDVNENVLLVKDTVLTQANIDKLLTIEHEQNNKMVAYIYNAAQLSQLEID